MYGETFSLPPPHDTNTSYSVVLPGASSAWIYIWTGVPQGSVLGSLLFLVYNSDIVDDIGANTRFFADDTSLFYPSRRSRQLLYA